MIAGFPSLQSTSPINQHSIFKCRLTTTNATLADTPSNCSSESPKTRSRSAPSAKRIKPADYLERVPQSCLKGQGFTKPTTEVTPIKKRQARTRRNRNPNRIQLATNPKGLIRNQPIRNRLQIPSRSLQVRSRTNLLSPTNRKRANLAVDAGVSIAKRTATPF